MTSENNRLVVPAPANTACGWWAYGESGHKLTCGSGRPAAHILTASLPVADEGTALCALHSPYDVTEADRAFTAEMSEAEPTGIETLADMLTIDAPAEVSTVRTPVSLVKFHRLSAPMVSVLLAVGALRGRADAWHMRNVIVHGATGATRATVKALINRGILDEVINENNTPGVSLTFYVVTERGAEILAALGCPMTFLPTDPAEADEYVRKAAVRPGDCSDGCEVASARSLPVGGMVCLGCGCTFTRFSEVTHPGVVAVSEAVVRRNQAKGH